MGIPMNRFIVSLRQPYCTSGGACAQDLSFRSDAAPVRLYQAAVLSVGEGEFPAARDHVELDITVPIQ